MLKDEQTFCKTLEEIDHRLVELWSCAQHKLRIKKTLLLTLLRLHGQIGCSYIGLFFYVAEQFAGSQVKQQTVLRWAHCAEHHFIFLDLPKYLSCTIFTTWH